MEKQIVWLDEKEKRLEKKILGDYSIGEIEKHLAYLTTLTRIAGTEDELKAANYIKGKLEEYKIDCHIHEFDAYISHPGAAQVEMIHPIRKSFPCVSNAFIGSTPPDGIEAPLVWVGKGMEEDYEGVDVKGKIALIKSAGSNQALAARVAETKGALAQVHIASGKNRAISTLQLRDTWGGPTPETLDRIAKTPAVTICSEDGQTLVEFAKRDPVVVKMKADAWTGYRPVRFPMGTLRGTREPEKFVLLAAHYCSWYVGATDNAVANSILLEIARLCSKRRRSLGRSIRFAWWAGHSQGAYAGSTWYADTFWNDIRDNAVAYFVMDGLGRAGSSGYAPRNTEEIRKFHEHVVKETLGLDVTSQRVRRSGDQSFGGMGLPSASGEGVFPAGANEGEKVWYSHTPEDTLDKVDKDVIATPFKVNTICALRLCNLPVFPFEFVTVSELFRSELADLQKGAESIFDLKSLIDDVSRLEGKAKALNTKVEKLLTANEKKRGDEKLERKFKRINACLMQLSRILNPLLASSSGRYGHDPMGVKFRPLPRLQSLEKMKSMDPQSELFKAFRTSLVRECNRVSDELHAAETLLDRTLERI